MLAVTTESSAGAGPLPYTMYWRSTWWVSSCHRSASRPENVVPHKIKPELGTSRQSKKPRSMSARHCNGQSGWDSVSRDHADRGNSDGWSSRKLWQKARRDNVLAKPVPGSVALMSRTVTWACVPAESGYSAHASKTLPNLPPGERDCTKDSCPYNTTLQC